MSITVSANGVSSIRTLQLERPPILVVGDVHTGATWVADILAAHPQVAVLSELRLFTDLGLEPPFRDSHWNPESSERMFDRRMGLGQWLPRERVTTDLRTLSDRWLARALAPEHRFLVERSPMGPPGVRSFANLYPDGTVITVIRDGRDVARSVLAERDQRLRSAEQDDMNPPARWRVLWSLSNGWLHHTKHLRELAGKVQVEFHELRYEDAVADPAHAARALFESCRIPCDRDLLTRILEQAGPPPRFGLPDWNRLERALYGAGAGELLHELGYTPPPAPGTRLLRRVLLTYERLKRVI